MRMASSPFCCGRAASPTRRKVVVTTLVTTVLAVSMLYNNAVEAHSSLRHRSLKQDELLTVDGKKKKISNDVKFIIFDDDSWITTTTTTSTTEATMAAPPSSSLTTASNNNDNVGEPTFSIPSPATTAISTASTSTTEAKILSSTPTASSTSSLSSTPTSNQLVSQQTSSFITTQVPTTTTHVTTTSEYLQPSSAPLSSTSSTTTLATAASITSMAPTPSIASTPSNSFNMVETESPTMVTNKSPVTMPPTSIERVASTSPTIGAVSNVPSPAGTEVPSSISSEVSSMPPSVQSSNNSSSSESSFTLPPPTESNPKESTIPTLSSSQTQLLTHGPTIAMMIESVKPTVATLVASSPTGVVDTEINESSSPVSSMPMAPTEGVVMSLAPSSSVGAKASQQPSVSVSSSSTVMTSSPSISSIVTSSPTTSHPSEPIVTSTPSQEITTSEPTPDQIVPTSQSPSPKPTEVLISTESPSTMSPSKAIVQSTSTSSTVVMTSQQPTSSATHNNIDSTNSIISCTEGTCPNPNNVCEAKVECFIDPCENASCYSGVCQANYCGGCHAICVQDDNDPVDVVVTMTNDVTLTQHPSTIPTAQPSKLLRPSKEDYDELTTDEVKASTTTTAPTLNSTLPKVQVPKLTFTLIETSGILSNQALEDVISSIEIFLTTQFDEHYNQNDNETFVGISLEVVHDVVVARAAPEKEGDGRRKLQSGVLIGTEISISGEAGFIQEPQPSSADIVGQILEFGERYNDYLISNITSSGNSELNDVFLVEVGYSSSLKGVDDKSFIEQTLPVQEDREGVDFNNDSGSSTNIINGLKMEQIDPDRYNRFIVIATVTGVATLTFLMFAFTSRDRSSHLHRNSRRSVGRDPVTVPISVLASGSRSRSRSSAGNGSRVEEEEVGSDPYIKCHKKGDSHISDLTTLASQPFARIVRSQSELDKDLESCQANSHVNSLSEMEREYVRKTFICDEEEGHFVNHRCNTCEEEDHYFTRVKSCYTQDYSAYYKNSRSRSQEERELPNNTGMIMDRSYLHRGWHASPEGGFWSSLNDYHRKSMESSIEESFSLPASGSIKHSESQPSESDSGSAQLSGRNSRSRRHNFCQASTPAASNIFAVNSFRRDECADEDNSVEQVEYHHSSRQTVLKASDDHTDTSSSNHDIVLSEEWLSAMHGESASVVSSNSKPCLYLDQVKNSFESSSSSLRNKVALSAEWLTAMHGEGASITSVLCESLQSLNQSTSVKSEDCTHASSLAENYVLPKEWLTALHGDGASVMSSHPDSHDDLVQTKSKSSENSTESQRNEVPPRKGCGGFLSSFDCGSGEEEEEESDQFAYPQHEKKSNRTTNEDAFSATSSERDNDQLSPQVDEGEIKMRDSADLLSLVDSIVGPSQVSLADLVWLEERIREKGVASKNDIASKDNVSNSEVKRGVEDE